MRANIQTDLGNIELYLDSEVAPITAGYFADIIRKGELDGSDFFRIVSAQSESSLNGSPIEVLQGGLWQPNSDEVDTIEFESTQVTGLLHKKWSLSTARFAVGTVYGSFFICMRDEPALDFGGNRHPDGSGFARFGHVAAGFPVIEEIYANREPNEFQKQSIVMQSVKLFS